MTATADLPRRLVRLLVVLVCAGGASWGFAAGPHATSHLLAGPASPGHHHHAPGGGHAPQATDDGTQARARRRVRDGVAHSRPARALAAWNALGSVVRRLMRARPTSPDRGLRPRHTAYWSSPTRLCVSRT